MSCSFPFSDQKLKPNYRYCSADLAKNCPLLGVKASLQRLLRVHAPGLVCFYSAIALLRIVLQ